MRFFVSVACCFLPALFIAAADGQMTPCRRISPIVTVGPVKDVAGMGIVVGEDRVLYEGLFSRAEIRQGIVVRYIESNKLGYDQFLSFRRSVPATVVRVDLVNRLTLLAVSLPPETVAFVFGEGAMVGQAVRWHLPGDAGYSLGKFSEDIPVVAGNNTFVLDEATRKLIGVISGARFVPIGTIRHLVGAGSLSVPPFLSSLSSCGILIVEQLESTRS